MINFEQVMAIIVAAAPSITAIVGIIFAVMKGIKNTRATVKEVMDKFESLREEVLNTKEYEALKDQYLMSLQENKALKKTIKELLTKIDRIQRED